MVFFDEFEAICPKRGADSTGVTDRVVNQFLCQLDGVEAREHVYVLAASSRPDLVDPALLRPGRLDKALFLGLPDAEERLDVLQAAARHVTLATGAEDALTTIAQQTDKFSNADLQAIIASAQLEYVHELLATAEAKGSTGSAPVAAAGSGSGGAKVVLTAQHLLSALSKANRSLSEKELAKFTKIYERFISSREDRDQVSHRK